jgi:hypothetical protein
MELSAGERTVLGTIDGYSIGFTVHLTILAGAAPAPTAPVPAPAASPTPSPSVVPSPKPSVLASPTPLPSPLPTPCAVLQRQTAYSQTVWPLAKANCAGCHATGGRPQFANATLATAYSVAIARVNTTTPTASKLYTKAKDGHCGACNATQGANFLAQMNRWFPAETTKDCNGLATPH